MKIYMVKDPSSQLPLGFFSNYEWALGVAAAMFPSYEEHHCLEEHELDPLKEQIEQGLFPWTIEINVSDGETRVGARGKLFNTEAVHYFQGPAALCEVFAATDEEAENRAQELWAEYNDKKVVRADIIWSIDFDEEAEVRSVHRYNSYSTEEVADSIQARGINVTARVVAATIQEAIEKAGKLYDAWIDKQIMSEE